MLGYLIFKVFIDQNVLLTQLAACHPPFLIGCIIIYINTFKVNELDLLDKKIYVKVSFALEQSHYYRILPLYMQTHNGKYISS